MVPVPPPATTKTRGSPSGRASSTPPNSGAYACSPRPNSPPITSWVKIWSGAPLARHAAVTDAHHVVGGLLREVYLVQGRHHGHVAPPRVEPQQLQHVYLRADVQVRSGLVEQQQPRLLAQRPGNERALPLAVAHVRKVAVSQLPGLRGLHGGPDRAAVLVGEDPQAPGKRAAPHLHHVTAGHELCAQSVGEERGADDGALGAGGSRRSRPAIHTTPARGASCPATVRKIVVLPDPLGPMSATICPGRTERSIPLTSERAPWPTARPAFSSTGASDARFFSPVAPVIDTLVSAA